VEIGTGRGERVAIYLEKRPEAVVGSFGTTAVGAVFVPVNPVLKPEQVAYILRDCNVRVLVTSPERLATLTSVLETCPDLRAIVVTGLPDPSIRLKQTIVAWSDLVGGDARAAGE